MYVVYWKSTLKYSENKPYREKQTDVNLAIDIVDDAHKKSYDIGVLVSGDTDFVGPLKMASRLEYRMLLIAPKCKSKELQQQICPHDQLIGFPKEMLYCPRFHLALY